MAERNDQQGMESEPARRVFFQISLKALFGITTVAGVVGLCARGCMDANRRAELSSAIKRWDSIKDLDPRADAGMNAILIEFELEALHDYLHGTPHSLSSVASRDARIAVLRPHANEFLKHAHNSPVAYRSASRESRPIRHHPIRWLWKLGELAELHTGELVDGETLKIVSSRKAQEYYALAESLPQGPYELVTVQDCVVEGDEILRPLRLNRADVGMHQARLRSLLKPHMIATLLNTRQKAQERQRQFSGANLGEIDFLDKRFPFRVAPIDDVDSNAFPNFIEIESIKAFGWAQKQLPEHERELMPQAQFRALIVDYAQQLFVKVRRVPNAPDNLVHMRNINSLLHIVDARRSDPDVGISDNAFSDMLNHIKMNSFSEPMKPDELQQIFLERR